MTTLHRRIKEIKLRETETQFLQEKKSSKTNDRVQESFVQNLIKLEEHLIVEQDEVELLNNTTITEQDHDLSSNDEYFSDKLYFNIKPKTIKNKKISKINVKSKKITKIKQVLDKAMDRIYTSKRNEQSNNVIGWWDKYWQENVKDLSHQKQLKHGDSASSDEEEIAQQKNVPIWCHYCNETYPSIHSVKNNYTSHVITVHGRTHSDSGQIECSICGVQKSTRERFRHHFQNHRTFPAAKKCPQAGCSMTFISARDYKAHKRLHNVKSDECPHCSYTSRSKASVKSHIVMKHLGGKFCKYCRHAIPIEKWEAHQQMEVDKKKMTPKTQFMCAVCGKEMSSRYSKNSHMKHSHPTKPATCEVCGQVFTGAATLQKHFIYHHAEKRFECDICGYKSHHKSRLQKHMQHSHVADRFTTCDVSAHEFKQRYIFLFFQTFFQLCGKTVYKRGLDYHLKAIHERKAQIIANKEFKCDYCELAFSHKDSKNKHMVKDHGQNRQFPCPACSNGYEVLNELQKHMQKSHSGTESHQQAIKNLEMASYKVVKNENGTFDLNKVTDIGCVFGDFSCKVCYKKFEILNTMRKHLDQHAELLPFTCKECKNGYFFEHQLEKHYKKMHDVKYTVQTYCDPKKQKGLSIAAKVLEFTIVNGDIRTCSRQERLSRYNYQPKQTNVKSKDDTKRNEN